MKRLLDIGELVNIDEHVKSALKQILEFFKLSLNFALTFLFVFEIRGSCYSLDYERTLFFLSPTCETREPRE